MNKSNQSDFLKTVRTALGQRPDIRRTPPPNLFSDTPPKQSVHLLKRVRDRSRADRMALLETLKAAAAPIDLQVLTVATDADAAQCIVDIASATPPEWGETKRICAWGHPLIDRLEVATALNALRIPVVTGPDPGDPQGGADGPDLPRTFIRDIEKCDIGITAADHCVAETATLVLRTRPAQPRSVSLLPGVHVAVITLTQVLADFKELYAVLRWKDGDGRVDLTNCLTFVSGPSKTADIEATLVHGVHGPRRVYLIVLTEDI